MAELPPPGPAGMTVATRSTVIVTGGRGIVGLELVPLLAERGFSVSAVSRRGAPSAGIASSASGAHPRNGEDGQKAPGSVRWVQGDLMDPQWAPGLSRVVGPAHGLFHLAPLWVLPDWLPAAVDAGIRRLVALSSTSRFTKAASGSPGEREVARRLAEAEQRVAEICCERTVRWTILRPTLIYSETRDRNVSDIVRLVRRFGLFPVAGRGRGRRQPVHAAEIAAACLAVFDNAATYDRAYDTPGGETLTYGEMVARIARGVGRQPRVVHVPLGLLRVVLRVASWLPGLEHLSPEVANRMEQDLVFDPTPARRDFGYDPGPFRFPGPQGGLG